MGIFESLPISPFTFHKVFLPLASISKVTTPESKNKLVESTADPSNPPGLFLKSNIIPCAFSSLIASVNASDNYMGVDSVY